jgi:hypothetical protein
VSTGSSALIVLKKLSAGALSKQLPFRDIDWVDLLGLYQFRKARASVLYALIGMEQQLIAERTPCFQAGIVVASAVMLPDSDQPTICRSAKSIIVVKYNNPIKVLYRPGTWLTPIRESLYTLTYGFRLI